MVNKATINSGPHNKITFSTTNISITIILLAGMIIQLQLLSYLLLLFQIKSVFSCGKDILLELFQILNFSTSKACSCVIVIDYFTFCNAILLSFQQL